MALHAYAHLGRGERLVVDAPDLRSVERVREVRAKCRDVEVVDAASDLFVDREADADRRVLDLGVLRQICDGGHDFGDTRFVVRSEQRRSVGRNDVVADLLGEEDTFGGTEDAPGIPGKLDVSTRVMDDLRLDLGSGLVRARVDVRDQADRRAARAGQRREHVAVLVDRGVLEPELSELACEELAEVALLRGARIRRRVVIGLRVDADVAQESVEDVVRQFGGDGR